MNWKKRLGEGGYGAVCAAVNKHTGVVYACKRIDKVDMLTKGGTRASTDNEITIMTPLDHTNIIKLVESFEDRRYVYMIMEQCTGGELFERLSNGGALNHLQAARIITQMLSAICYLHENRIVHCDLKPENFLFASDAEDAPLK